ncbi:DUF2975 domain-containing protein [Ruminococcus flavefaciens]|uniref:DUF2975 domain-containing protein n=1 Tax=Ruminococcus flavefaciens TaxID=1265 RepID=UPI00030C4DAA|nr:DUF2975 domain-containing protein [Ruminococcus flavefaciens]
MDKEKLTKKINKLSKFVVCAMVVYFMLNCCGIWPDTKSGDTVSLDVDKVPFWKASLGIVTIVLIIASVIGVYIQTYRLMSGLSRNSTPFTQKTANIVRDLGIFFIIMEIAGDTFMFIAGGVVNVNFFWLAGLIMYSFSLVFRYGSNLQRESDETL